MQRPYCIRTFIALIAVLLAGCAAEQAPVPKAGKPPVAHKQHLEKLKQAIPGNGGESQQGPIGAAEMAYLARAYPADTVSVDQMSAARATFKSTRGRPFPQGRGRPGTWVSVGPSQALYPLNEFRTSSNYVPNEYLAAGRTTSIAISPRCVVGDCRLWVLGIW